MASECGCAWMCVLLILYYCSLPQLAESQRECFCKSDASVNECACTVESVDQFNNLKVFPLLDDLLNRDFFKFYKVNMEKTCPFWPDTRECSSEACGIENCDEQVPAAFKNPVPNKKQWSQDVPSPNADPKPCGESNEFDPLDTHISKHDKEQFNKWANFDDSENKFCDVDEDNDLDMHYVDLQRNPERYTGYKGNSAQKVWKSIYLENCFKPDPKFDKNFLLHPTVTGVDLEGLCLEKRVFYRLISGLHTSITVSIAAHSYKEPPGGLGKGSWYRNMEMFKWRFSPETTNGEGPERLKNMYFVYLLELRALNKVGPYLSREMFYTGDREQDEDTRRLMENLLDTVAQFHSQFDETAMFQGIEAHARELKEEFRGKFHNISRIMDCVDCDKCRLWGKVQTHGIGTALKILFSQQPGHKIYPENTGRPVTFQLTRNELIALIQSFGRFAANIREVDQFRRLVK